MLQLPKVTLNIERLDSMARHNTDEELLKNLRQCLINERRLQAKFIAFLGEVDRRMLYAYEGYPSLHAFCVEVLGLSEHSALKRIQIARLCRKCPLVFDAIETCRVSLSALNRMAPFMTNENHLEMLEWAENKTVRSVEKELACRFPDFVSAKESLEKIRFLSSDRVEVAFSASTKFAEKLEKAKEVLSHQCPSGKLEEIFGKALDLVLEKHVPKSEKKEKNHVESHMSRDMLVSSQSRHIPVSIQREVRERDHGSCTYRAKNGKVCGSRVRVEFDHVQLWALGGEHSVENLRLLCRTHNKLAAREAFDARWSFAVSR